MRRILAKIAYERQRNSSLRENENRDSADDGATGRSDRLIQDQVILAPEIMTKILEHLDFRALKNVRLVCKSWLLETQSHMENRGIVWLGGNDKCYTTRIQEFIGLRENKVPALPQPFAALEVDLNCCSGPAGPHNHKLILSQLGNLLPPLLLTRFSPMEVPLNLVLPLIIQCSSSLEYLKLCAWDCEEGFRIPVAGIIADIKFPNLRELDIDAGVINYTEELNDFPETVAWIMKASPNICIFQTLLYAGDPLDGIANEVLVEVDLTNVTTLILGWFWLSYYTKEHLASTAFSRLHTVSITNHNKYAMEALVAVVKRAANTLKRLDLPDAENLLGGTDPEFPVCPNLQKLELHLFPGWSDCVARCFPALEYFSPAVYYSSRREKDTFRGSSPFHGVKTLELRNARYRPESFRPIELFSTFPALKRLSIHPSFLFEHFGMKPSTDPIFLYILKGLKHLELQETDSDWFDKTNGAGYSFIAGLKGVETLTVTTVGEVTKMPVRELRGLKALRLNWKVYGHGCDKLNMEKLLEVARGVGRVVILNHCSIMRERQSRSTDLLQEFFETVPNAVCGCKEQEELSWVSVT